MRALAPQAHQRGVNHDAGQPARELRAPFEPAQVLEGRKHAFLQGILGVFGIAEQLQGALVERTRVAGKERFERGLISLQAQPDQTLLVAKDFVVVGATQSVLHVSVIS